MPINQQTVHLSSAVFKAGSYITIENKHDNDVFFIILKGKVKSTKSIYSILGHPEQLLGPGDFFGVIGAMTGHPRIESCIAVQDTTLIICKKSQFGFLIQKNTPLAMKIIRCFSTSLRRYNIELAKRTTESIHNEDNPDSLFNVGSYYHRINNYKLSAYIFQRYLKLNPNGNYVEKAKELLDFIGNIRLAQFETKDFTRIYNDGEMIFSEYEKGEELYVIQSGKVKITKIINDQELLIAVLNPGDIFGEMAILDNEPRTAGAIAFGEVKLLAVNKINFERVVIKNAAMATKLITLLSERIWTIYRQLGSLLLDSKKARLYDTLLTQILKAKISLETNRGYLFSFGVNELLKMVGIEEDEDSLINEMMEGNNIFLNNNKLECKSILELKKEVDFAKRMQEREMRLKAFNQL